AQSYVLARANGDVPAVAIHVGALPQTLADVANLFLQIPAISGIKEGVELAFGTFGTEWLGGRGSDCSLAARVRGSARGAVATPHQVAQQVFRRRCQDGVGGEPLQVAAFGEQILDVFGRNDRSHNKME